MHGTSQLSWKSALLTGWIVGLAASAIAQPPGSAGEAPMRAAVLLARLSLDAAEPLDAAAPLGARLAELEGWLARAYFSEVVQAAGELRASTRLASAPRERARLEVLAGTAHVALGSASPAVSCFKRALQAWPELELPRRTTSPKVLHAFAAARRELQSAALAPDGRQDRRARLIEGAPPIQPASSGALRPTILCRLLIDARGAVVSASVQRPRRDLARFEEIALASVREYRFEPAQRNGQPVSSWLNWPVQF